jgi:hypothetical protein
MNLSSLNSILYGILQNEADLCPKLKGYTIMDRIVEDEVMIYKKNHSGGNIGFKMIH